MTRLRLFHLFLLLSGFIGPVCFAQSSPPLLSFYEPTPDAKNPGNLTFDPSKPLLQIFDISDKRLARDNKGVLIRLSPSDTESFAALTRKYSGEYLIIAGADAVVEVLHITAPIEDGYIGFRYPEEERMAAYLRAKLFEPQK